MFQGTPLIGWFTCRAAIGLLAMFWQCNSVVRNQEHGLRAPNSPGSTMEWPSRSKTIHAYAGQAAIISCYFAPGCTVVPVDMQAIGGAGLKLCRHLSDYCDRIHHALHQHCCLPASRNGEDSPVGNLRPESAEARAQRRISVHPVAL